MARWQLGLGLALAIGCGDDAPSTPDTDGGTTGGDTVTTTGGAQTTGGAETDVADGSSSSGAPLAFCEGSTALIYDPAAKGLDAFPDDVFTIEADTATGRALSLQVGDNVELSGTIGLFARVFEQANTLDGFGTTAGFYFRFDGPLDAATLPTTDVADPMDGVVMVDLDAQPPAFVAIEADLVAENPGESTTTLVLEPLVPLQPGHRYGVGLTQRVRDADGGCITPSPAMLAALQGDAEPPVDTVQSGVDALIAALVDAGTVRGAEDLSAAVVFTTQTTVDEAAAIATEIRSTAAPTFTPDEPGCEEPEEGAMMQVCRGVLDVLDYTGEDEALAPDLVAPGSYELPMVAFVPTQGEGPFPTIVYGHGLGGSRDQAALLADLFGPEGYAIVAVDAPKHGAHPDGGDDSVLDFFGLSLDFSDPLDALKLRDNFRQGSFDRLQLVEALKAGIDVDGDGQTDVDAANLHYLGVSLGGIMGPGVVAFAPEFKTATFVVPGARSTAIVRDGESFSSLLDLFASAATDGELARFFPVVQSVIDRGDAGVYGVHVLPGTRLPGFDDAAPSVLGQMVIGDDTVPNSTNRFFTRAMGLPHVGEVLQPIGVVPQQAELPTAANLDDEHTAGMFQFDIVEGGGPATHSGIAVSDVGQLQMRTFVVSSERGVPEILDPYVELGVE
ncbi:MAG: hypothetical protein AAGA54_32515 [Myxococcota bacterium]